MSSKSQSTRTVIRYALLQLPEIILLALILLLVRHWIDIPIWIIVGIILVMIAKDAILYPFLKKAYDPYRSRNRSAAIGSTGVATDRLAPTGYVQIEGELWKAEVIEGFPPVEKGATVQVKGIQKLKLMVQPIHDENANSAS